jgi:cytochrome c-type biogenesis protein CcmH/NrfG
LWFRGSLAGLGLAVAFSLLLNFALAGTFLWNEWAPTTVINSIWVALTVIWMGSVVGAFRWGWNDSSAKHPEEMATFFRQAQQAYLRGEWVKAETTLKTVLCHDPEDLESRLLLATLYRHTRRYDEAKAALTQLVRFPGSGKWGCEIQQELQLLADSPGEETSILTDELEPAQTTTRTGGNDDAEYSDEQATENGTDHEDRAEDGTKSSDVHVKDTGREGNNVFEAA